MYKMARARRIVCFGRGFVSVASALRGRRDCAPESVENRVNCSNPLAVAAVLTALAASARAQTTQPSIQEIDACGTLVQVGRCVLFSGGGGNYVLSDYGDFNIGDAVRVVGTVNTNCTSICSEADGCVQGAIVYDPIALPCGTPIPDLQTDLANASIDALCNAASGAIATAGLVGMALTRRSGHRPDNSRRVSSR